MSSGKNTRLNVRRRKKQQARMLKSVGKLVLGVGFILALIVVFWNVFGGRLKDTKIYSNYTAQASETSETRDPDGKYGNGNAGVYKLYSTPENPAPGWQYSSDGWWYAVSKSTYYANGWAEIDGKKYHFDEEGYISTGWTAIGGYGYYFDEHGVYDEGRDSSKMIALTFDDGPSEYTSRLLDILENNGAEATFFMLGNMVQYYGDGNIQRMEALGCAVGNHSWDHPYMPDLSVEAVLTQFHMTDDEIAKYNNGQGASVYRFPYGDYDEERLKATERPCFFWELDSLDWEYLDAQAVADRVLSTVEPGCIVLLHDIFESTVDACEIIVPQLISQGYELVDIRTLAAARGFELEGGVNYFGFTDYYVQQHLAELYPEEEVDTEETVQETETTEEPAAETQSEGQEAAE